VARISVLETALNKIAYAGMSASQEMSNDYKQAWHASRAWEFIGIAAQAIDQESTPVQEPTLQEQLEKAKADWRKAYAEIERIEKLMEKNND
jgi:flagellar biosynthesis chaperone FliJ